MDAVPPLETIMLRRGTEAPTFTVVIPLYNKAAYIGATLTSVAAQTWRDWEAIVVDDGSRDDGPEQVEAVGGHVRLIRQDNAGPGIARNRGIEQARGAWVAFIDADDLWAPDHLATLAGAITSCPGADVVATGFTRATRADATTPDTLRGEARYFDFFDEHRLVWTSAAAVRTSALRSERFGAHWPGEDVDLWTRLALRHRFAAHPARTAIYIQQTGGAMDSQDASSAVAIADQPVFATINAILSDSKWSSRHAAVSGFRNALLLEYTRPALFRGQTALARSYLQALHRGGGRAPLAYTVLSHLPGPLVRRGSRTFGMIKHALGY